jgi:hypothetical protein
VLLHYWVMTGRIECGMTSWVGSQISINSFTDKNQHGSPHEKTYLIFVCENTKCIPMYAFKYGPGLPDGFFQTKNPNLGKYMWAFER